MSDSILKIKGLSKTYPDGTRALRNVSVDFARGERVVILGLSGAGKSTFLRTINRLVNPETGEIVFQPISNGKTYDMTRLSFSQLREPRSKIAMIFQHFNLIDRLTVLKNVLSGGLSTMGMGQSIFHVFTKDQTEFAMNCIERVGLTDRAYMKASELSGGQKQRVGIARALMQRPSLMLADEPVASLDPATSLVILDVLSRVTEEDGITTLINLHSIEHAKGFAKRVVAFKAGEIVYDGMMENLSDDEIKKIYVS